MPFETRKETVNVERQVWLDDPIEATHGGAFNGSFAVVLGPLLFCTLTFLIIVASVSH
jgi:hypothetical protein